MKVNAILDQKYCLCEWTGDGSLVEIGPLEPDADILAPGFADVHIHGAFGIDFMSASIADILSLADQLEAIGYESFLPTTVTASADAVQNALENLPTHRAIAGVHLEGPFISPDFPGAQPESAILSADPIPSEWEPILSDMRVKRITLAPEIPGGLDLVRRMCSRGVVVSMGHTAATYDQASDAQLVGVSTLTHTFNAMSPIHHRHPGALGYALEDSDISCELIYDRLHVHPAVAKILLKTKSKERVIAVSDSTAATGLPDGTKINMWGHPCHVSEGAVRLDSNDTLAGSTITLLDAFRNLAEDFGAIAAIRTCCMNPRTSMGLTGPPRVWNRFSSSFELLETVRIEP